MTPRTANEYGKCASCHEDYYPEDLVGEVSYIDGLCCSDCLHGYGIL